MAGPEQRPDADAPDISQLSEDIEHTRAAVGETVAALADKLDVKKQTQQKVAATRAKIPAAPATVATVAIVAGLILWRRRRQGGSS